MLFNFISMEQLSQMLNKLKLQLLHRMQIVQLTMLQQVEMIIMKVRVKVMLKKKNLCSNTVLNM